MFRVAYLLAIAVFSVLASPEPTAARRIQQRFLAPCCWNESLDAHGSAVAAEMRAEIVRMVNEGKTEQEIVEHYVSIHGERILREPRGPAFGWLHVIPVFAVLAGLVWISRFIRQHRMPVEALSMAGAAAQPQFVSDDELE